MNRPYVICHMPISVDGKVTGDFLRAERGKDGIEEFYRINHSFKAEAFACGVSIMAPCFTDNFKLDLTPYADVKIDRSDFIAEAENEGKRYALCFDRYGEVGWKTPYIESEDPGYDGCHIVQVMCECVPDAYLAYLRDIGVSYVFAGDTDMDILVALEKLNELFCIESIVLCGGAVLNGAFYQADLIDEISLVVLTVSSKDTDKTLFDDNTGRKFKMKSSKAIKKGVAWVRYERG